MDTATDQYNAQVDASARDTVAHAAIDTLRHPERLPSFTRVAAVVDSFAVRLPWWLVLGAGVGVGYAVWGRKRST